MTGLPKASNTAATSGTQPAGSSVVELVVEQMRRSHLRAVLQIDRAVYQRPWSKSLYLDELSQPRNRLYLVARDRRTVIGYVGLIAVAGEGHIASLAVDPSTQNQGVGSVLLLALHQAVRNKRLPGPDPVGEDIAAIQHMTLEVRASNLIAQRLYSKFGYAPVGTRASYYRGRPGQKREDAIVMWCHDINNAKHGERLQNIAKGSTAVSPATTRTASA